MEQFEVKYLSLPPLLLELLESGRWMHPGDEVLRQVIPFLREEMKFFDEAGTMQIGLMDFIADDPTLTNSFRMARGTKSIEPICLPWLDVELAIFVALNQFQGEEQAIALDYRTGATDPRVVAMDWQPFVQGCYWREVAPTFSQFVRLLGI